MPISTRYYRPARPAQGHPLLWAAPGLLLAGAIFGHLLLAVW